MSNIAIQPLEFKDFSGGMTENILLGDITKFEKGDSLLITEDRKLITRDGTVLYDDAFCSLPIPIRHRISSLFGAINDTKLFAVTGRDIYTQIPDEDIWTAIRGDNGNQALSNGTGLYDQVTTAEFQKQIYFTSDAFTQPGKLFRDQDNTWKTVTAGLPKMQWVAAPSENQILLSCITLANALRASMLAHMKDQSGTSPITSSSYLHWALDKYSLSYLETQSWTGTEPEYPGPTPTPTAAADATDLASLITLCQAMALAYEHHRNDLGGTNPQVAPSDTNFYYHQEFSTNPSHGLAARLEVSGVVSDGYEAARFLNDLAQKWYWHQLLPYGHDSNNDYTFLKKYLVTAPKITNLTDSTLIQVEPNYDDFIAFAGWVRTAHVKHIGNQSSFSQHATSGSAAHLNLDQYPAPFDYDSSALWIYSARRTYREHILSATTAVFAAFTFDTTAGSVNITNVTKSASPYTLPVNFYFTTLTNVFTDTDTYSQKGARVVSAGAGTATLSKPAQATATGVTGQVSLDPQHVYLVSGAFDDTSTTQVGAGETLDEPYAIGNSLSTWIDLGADYLVTLGTHEDNSKLHYLDGVLATDLSGVSSINGNPFFIPQVETYAYAAFRRYSWVVEQDGLFYLNQGAPIYSESIETFPSYPVGTLLTSSNSNFFNDCRIAQTNPSVTITHIPPLENDLATNYDTTVSVAPIPTTGTGSYNNLTTELYKTTDGGTTFYYLDSVDNSTTSYEDTTNDAYPELGWAALSSGKTMYTSGGVVANDQPPVCKFIHTVNGFTYYANLYDSGQLLPGRIRQSIQFAPDSAPARFFDDVEDEIVALTSCRNNLIAICKSSVYRISGFFNSTGQGSMSHEKISQGVGGLNAQSVVQTEVGTFFAGTDGFYYTDGYQLINITLELKKKYASYTQSDTQKKSIHGAYDTLGRRIWWSMQSSPSATGNDTFLVYHLNFGVKPAGVFTEHYSEDSWLPASHTFFGGRLIIGDERNYLFKSDPDTKTDPKVDTTALDPATDWITTHIPWDYKSCAIDFGTTFQRKWVTKIHIIGENVGDNSIQVNSINGLGINPSGTSSVKSLAPIQYVSNCRWGDPNFTWGDSDVIWNPKGAMDVWRRFPASTLRADFKQIQLVPGDFVLYKSDNFPFGCFATVNATTKTATIQTPSGYTLISWPADAVDYYISFDTDNYETSYLINSLATNDTVITYSDSANESITSAAAKWQISGYRKQNRVKISSLDLHYGFLGSENEAYPGPSGTGGQGGNAT
jgi:hypothetical protein